ncbi:hypothetical protein ACFFQF_02435 [Haladaptatus pallidirubidus]|uniref:DUF7313 domain-containing protein n=1 Tax=Haladaptatus pallidirubidus TaxID=1008152 RepID=A0AAV3UBD7_9EURY|nr:hypothetical protein [Haladaptatus pallidirubidus]
MQALSLLGPLDALEPIVRYLILVLVLVNMGTRMLAFRNYRKQARDDDRETLNRWVPHELSNMVLVLASFYFLTLHHHAGIVLSTLVLGLFITDFFEVEARSVEMRRGVPLDKPKAAVTASFVVFLYAAYQSVFFLIEPFWSAIV